MWVWKDAATIPASPWQGKELLESLFSFLRVRAEQPLDWLEDNSKYIDIRFDSRTGSFVVQDWFDRKFLVWVD